MKRNQNGFTIIELLIATTVFTVVMILCLTAFLRVGQLYYKGIYLSRTQEVTRNISDDIVNQLRLNGSPGLLQKSVNQITNNGKLYDVYFLCAGSKRYSLMSNNVVNTITESNTNFGLVTDNLPATGCVSPVAPTSGPLDVNPTELLSDKMRVVATSTPVTMTPDNADLYLNCLSGTPYTCDLHIHVDFGDDDLLVNSTGANFSSIASGVPKGSCSGPLQGSQFCATTDLDTSIYPLQ